MEAPKERLIRTLTEAIEIALADKESNCEIHHKELNELFELIKEINNDNHVTDIDWETYSKKFNKLLRLTQDIKNCKHFNKQVTKKGTEVIKCKNYIPDCNLEDCSFCIRNEY